MALVCGIVSLFGLAKKRPVENTHSSLKEMILSGFVSMKDPYVVLAYLSCFAARGDSSVVTLFLSIWIQQFGADHHIDKAVAFARAGEVSGVIQVIALCSAPFIGVIADRFSRAMVTFVVSLIGVLGYVLLGTLSDPYNWSVQLGLSMLFLGIGEMGVLIMSQSILGLHAPTATRGSISGFWAMCGSLGIMFGSGVGGVLYDLNPGSPFFIFAGFNCVVACLALVLFVREKLKVNKDAILEVNEDEKTTVAEQEHLIQNEPLVLNK